MANVRAVILSSSGEAKELADADVLIVSAALFSSISGDLDSPVDGNIWYNSSTGKFRKKQDGVVSDLDTGGGTGITAEEAIGYALIFG